MVTIQFDKNVVVTGKPQILLATGTTNRLVDYVGMTNFDTLRFNYVVQGGDTSNDLDYVGTTSLTLNGGTIKLGSNNAVLTLPAPGASGSLGFNKNIVIDTTPPIVAISSPSDDATLNTATVVVSGISSDTIGSGVQKVEVSIDSGSYTLAYGTTAWSFTTSELSIGSHTITAKATDIAGNTATTSTITITVAPLTLVLSSTSYVHGATATYTGTMEFHSSINVNNIRYLIVTIPVGYSIDQTAGLRGTFKIADKSGNDWIDRVIIKMYSVSTNTVKFEYSTNNWGTYKTSSNFVLSSPMTIATTTLTYLAPTSSEGNVDLVLGTIGPIDRDQKVTVVLDVINPTTGLKTWTATAKDQKTGGTVSYSNSIGVTIT